MLKIVAKSVKIPPIMNLIERSDKVLSKVLGHFTQLEVERGEGSYLYGYDGKRYLDFASGIAVTNTGHCHPKVVAAAEAQLKKLVHNCAGVTYTAANIEFAEALQKVVPIQDARFFLTQSGSEAVEGALKAAKYVSGKSGIIALKAGFHGRTLGALSVTSSKDLYTEGYGPLVPHTYFADYNLDSIKSLNNGNIAAVLTELVRGEGGYAAHEKKFIQDLRAYCTENKIFLIIDEVQTGFGRTGKLFASEWYGIEPDLMAIAKGIASGFPLGAVVMKVEISDKWKTSTHGGTYTGNLVSCAAGIASLEIILAELPKMHEKINVLEKGLDNLISKHPALFKGRQGLGFMIGLKCISGAACAELRKKALANGLLLISSGAEGEVVRLAPPVTISVAELEAGLSVLDKAAQ